jgi:hypothetical protein
VWEFYLHAYRLQPMPDAVRERLARSLEFVRNVMDASGYVPQVGDEDDGTVVPALERSGGSASGGGARVGAGAGLRAAACV